MFGSVLQARREPSLLEQPADPRALTAVKARRVPVSSWPVSPADLPEIKVPAPAVSYRCVMPRPSLRSAVLAAIAVIGVAGGLAWWNAQRSAAPSYRTALISVGSVSRQIVASGSVNPVVTVQVGAFVSGNIQALACDFNTRVRRGQVCATIDPRPYQLTVDQDRAALGASRAQLTRDRASLAYAETAYKRDLELIAVDSISHDAVDNALNLRDQAHAQVDLDAATVRQRQAALSAAQVNLEYTKISSPVDGTVVSRNVNVGQTVAASFQTPTLFLIAQDLTKMQVDANVSESDIGGVAMGAPATFTVDAYPGRRFAGRVTQVRKAPLSVQNVITYDVVIAADNPQLLLMPGMTATTSIVISRRDGVLRVPVQALHYSPSGGAGGPLPATFERGPSRIWLLREGRPEPVAVALGLQDGVFAEVSGAGLRPGGAVIVSEGRTTPRRAAPPAVRFGA